jgi:hypothetical protein
MQDVPDADERPDDQDVAGDSQPGVASRGVGLSTFARSGEVSPLSRASGRRLSSSAG